MRRSMLITVEAAPERVRRVLVDELGLHLTGDLLRDDLLAVEEGRYVGPIAGMPDTTSTLTVTLTEATPVDPTQVRLVAESTVVVPFFTWFLRLQAWLGARRALPHAAERLRAALVDAPPPAPLKSLPIVPPVPFTPEQAGRLCALAAVALLANFSGGLLSQNVDAVTSAFG
ncbi:MAG: hypothetical protein ACHQDE_01385, partial [Acidimicrobiia bacterium]